MKKEKIATKKAIETDHKAWCLLGNFKVLRFRKYFGVDFGSAQSTPKIIFYVFFLKFQLLLAKKYFWLPKVPNNETANRRLHPETSLCYRLWLQ